MSQIQHSNKITHEEFDQDSEIMTSSYHEIDQLEDKNIMNEDNSSSLNQIDEKARKLLDKARHWVGDLSLEGIVTQEGQKVTYVAQDIDTKIRLASPTSELQSSTSTTTKQSENIDNIRQSNDYSTSNEDLNSIVNDIEVEAKKLAFSIDTLTENLTGILHSLSAMTVDCTFVASDGVTQLCDTADASIKVMYQVMAKSEELNRAVQPIYRVHQQIKETKRLLDKVEAEMN